MDGNSVGPARRLWRLCLAFCLCVILSLPLAACVVSPVAIQVDVQPLPAHSPCGGSFVEHELPHVTGTAFERVTYFASNGAGLAIGDLDNDGDEDFVLANLLGPNHIFWNQGGMEFRPQVLFDGSLRAVALVDVDGDTWLDITATSRSGSVLVWHNVGGTDAELPFPTDQRPARLSGVEGYAYSLQWADLDRDGDLDLVTGSYDASMEKQIGRRALDASNLGGVFVYMQADDGRFEAERLASQAQALALHLLDADGDGLLDILVGNDFDMQDLLLLAADDGRWQAAAPFARTTFSTMSFDADDIDNDGTLELFAADMHPYSEESGIMRQWEPVLQTMPPPDPAHAPQTMANVLQTRTGDGGWVDRAPDWGIPYSGWSWSAQFGDLDQDGFLDLYIVNGMTAQELFSHLPNDELVEENQAYRNEGGRRFVPEPAWNLNSTAGGRGMGLADLDGDGDLDVLVNNLRSPARIFENQLCTGQSLVVHLSQAGTGNTRALGAEVRLQTTTGVYRRQVQAASGYLSGRSPALHFGLPEGSEILALEVRWPDGTASLIGGQSLQPNSRVAVSR